VVRTSNISSGGMGYRKTISLRAIYGDWLDWMTAFTPVVVAFSFLRMASGAEFETWETNLGNHRTEAKFLRFEDDHIFLDEFLRQHAASLWQCDFFSRRILTATGIRQAFVLAFIHVQTRRVILSPATLHPNEEWVVAQAAAFVKQARGDRILLRPFGTRLSCEFEKLDESFTNRARSGNCTQ